MDRRDRGAVEERRRTAVGRVEDGATAWCVGSGHRRYAETLRDELARQRARGRRVPGIAASRPSRSSTREPKRFGPERGLTSRPERTKDNAAA
jgi:hypothetical protein